MLAIVTCDTITYGCQPINGKMSDWTSGGHIESQCVEFTHNPELSDWVNATKHFKPMFQFGNSVRIPISFDVEIIP